VDVESHPRAVSINTGHISTRGCPRVGDNEPKSEPTKPRCRVCDTGQGRQKVRAHDAGLKPQQKKKTLGSRVAQRGLGRHGSIETRGMFRMVGHTGGDLGVPRAISGNDVGKLNSR
jgi:hypothetical protein